MTSIAAQQSRSLSRILFAASLATILSVPPNRLTAEEVFVTPLVTPLRPRPEDVLASKLLKAVESPSGLIVHLGVSDGALTRALSSDGKFLVHGLSGNPENVARARRTIGSWKILDGAVSVEHASYERLPYADNLVNVLVADDVPALLQQGLSLRDVFRVLRPNGIAYFGHSKLGGKSKLTTQQLKALLAEAGVMDLEMTESPVGWARVRKPRPGTMDEWTHRAYDPSGNRVSRDKVVGIPTGVRWVAGPNWPTGNRKAAVPTVVASQDRLVYTFDDELQTDKGPQRQKTLVGRDAFNGILLWKRKTAESPILLTVGDRVYTVVADRGPLVALDANTGKVVHEYKEFGQPSEIMHHGNALVVRIGSEIRAIDAASGKQIWLAESAGQNVCAGDGRLYFQGDKLQPDGRKVSALGCLDLATGNEVWRTSTRDWAGKSSPALIFYQNGILVLGGNGTHGVSAKDGKHLWSYQYKLIGHGGSYNKVMYVDNLVWVHNAASAADDKSTSYAWEGLDPITGKLKKRLPHPVVKHRCFTDVATGRYFLCGSMDFVDLETKQHKRFAAARNSCRTAGVIPANGLVYTFPHGCACYPLLRGFMGLTDASQSAQPVTAASRLQAGSSFEPAGRPKLTDDDWSTYRHDVHRSGSTSAAGPENLKAVWERVLSAAERGPLSPEWDQKDGGRLTSSVAANGLVFAASSDAHELFALNADTGETRWTFTAGGRIDCPPSIYPGLCLFGARDGWVYCLRARDGAMVWRYRAAPAEQRILAYAQLESPWPVVGGVLLHNDLAYFAVGRHSASDGGIHVYAADPLTGEIVWHEVPDGFTSLPDLLVADAGEIHMSSWQFDAKTGKNHESKSSEFLRSTRLGLLNDAWYKRPLALRKNLQQWSQGSASGQLLVFNKNWTCGFKGPSKVSGSDGSISGDCELYAKPNAGQGGWSTKLPLGTLVKSMVLTDEKLFVAGRLNGFDPKSNAVRAYTVADGKQSAEYSIGSPVIHECLSVAGDKLYVSTQDGRLICLGDK